MRVVLRCLVRDPRATRGQRYRQTVHDVAELTVGRGAEQLIQIPDARVAIRHALIEQKNDEFYVTALTRNGVIVNDAVRRSAVLRSGDVISLADRHLTVDEIRPAGVILLRLGLPRESASGAAVAPAHQSLKDTGLRATGASWWLVLGVFVVTLAAPLLSSLNTPLRPHLRAAPLLPSDTLWLPGPLHAAHQSIGRDCNTCHSAPFSRVTNQACANCHAGTPHHVPEDSPVRPLFTGMQCTGCHVEHSTPSQLVDTGSRQCTVCHADLHKLDAQTALQNASDFGSDHPGFSRALLEPEGEGKDTVWNTRIESSDFRPRTQEHSNLKFSHEVHMDKRGVKSPDGDQVLKCGDCHQADASGRNMAPIRMEPHCSRCHSLLYDENDPASAVPHGALVPMFAALEGHFSRMFLQPAAHGVGTAARRRPGGEQTVMSRDEQRRALEWTRRESLQAAHELLEKRVCVQCHTVSHVPGRSGYDQWRIEPVKLASSWMPRAQFSHAAHRSSACTSCHGAAEHSRSSADVLMPEIKDCRGCHGGSGDRSRLASDCTMCHRLHLPGRGDYVPVSADKPLAAAGPSPKGSPL
jgi:predicted CXXCH cytochrome family protein